MLQNLIAYEAFLALGFGLIDSARLTSLSCKHAGFVSYYKFGFNE